MTHHYDSPITIRFSTTWIGGTRALRTGGWMSSSARSLTRHWWMDSIGTILSLGTKGRGSVTGLHPRSLRTSTSTCRRRDLKGTSASRVEGGSAQAARATTRRRTWQTASALASTATAPATIRPRASSKTYRPRRRCRILQCSFTCRTRTSTTFLTMARDDYLQTLCFSLSRGALLGAPPPPPPPPPSMSAHPFSALSVR